MPDDDHAKMPMRPRVAAEALPEGARGIALCLRKLADEAADLGLMSSHAAIRRAIDACEAEVAALGPRAGGWNLN